MSSAAEHLDRLPSPFPPTVDLADIPSTIYPYPLLYPRPQLLRESPDLAQATPAQELGRVTADLQLSVCYNSQ